VESAIEVSRIYVTAIAIMLNQLYKFKTKSKRVEGLGIEESTGQMCKSMASVTFYPAKILMGYL
jgi:hypothetical protein